MLLRFSGYRPSFTEFADSLPSAWNPSYSRASFNVRICYEHLGFPFHLQSYCVLIHIFKAGGIAEFQSVLPVIVGDRHLEVFPRFPYLRLAHLGGCRGGWRVRRLGLDQCRVVDPGCRRSRHDADCDCRGDCPHRFSHDDTPPHLLYGVKCNNRSYISIR